MENKPEPELKGIQKAASRHFRNPRLVALVDSQTRVGVEKYGQRLEDQRYFWTSHTHLAWTPCNSFEEGKAMAEEHYKQTLLGMLVEIGGSDGQ